MKQRTGSMRTLLGLGFVLLGMLFLLDTTNVIDTGSLAKWIPSLFILLGVFRLVSSGFKDMTGSLVLIGIALIVQLAVLDLIDQLWPVVLIILGAVILFRGRGPNVRQAPASNAPASPSMIANDVDVMAVLGGVDRRVTSSAFRGGRATAVMGSANIDLRDAAIAERPATLDITTIMGGIDIRVPADWHVRIDAMALAGAATDERRDRQTPTDGPPHLVITGIVLLGGASVKS